MRADNKRHALPKGLDATVVAYISEKKNEPLWMKELRLRALTLFEKKGMPQWGPDLSSFNPSDICYYIKPDANQSSTWDMVPENIKKTFNALGIPQAEQRYLAGVGAQYESEVIYKRLKKEWVDQGVVF